MDDWTGSDTQIDALIADLPTYDAPDSAIAAVLEAVAADRVEPAPARRLPWPMLAAAAAALIALGFGAASMRPEPPPGLAIKGVAAPTAPASVSLGLSVLRDGAPVALPPGEAARASDSVLLRYSTDRAGFAYLFRVDGQQVEVFHGVATPAGTHHVTSDGQVLGYPLAGLTGAQRFGMAWTADAWPAGEQGPTPPPELVSALAGGEARGSLQAEGLGAVSVDVASVRIAPEADSL